jgi:hypothetical protein
MDIADMSTPGSHAPVVTAVIPTDQTTHTVTITDLIHDYNIHFADVFAVILCVSGLIALILGAGVSAVISGVFWVGGVCAVLAGLSCLAVKMCESETLSMLEYIPLVGGVVGILISLFSVIGNHSIISRIDACASDAGVFGSETDDHSGVFDANALSCHTQNSDFDCSCIVESIDDKCFNFDMTKSGGDCGPLVGDRLPALLKSTSICLWFVFACIILVSVLMCHREGCFGNGPRSRSGSITLVEGVTMTQVPSSIVVAAASRTNSHTSDRGGVDGGGAASGSTAAETAKLQYITVSAAVVQSGAGYTESDIPEAAAGEQSSTATSPGTGLSTSSGGAVQRGLPALPIVAARAVSGDVNV